MDRNDPAQRSVLDRVGRPAAMTACVGLALVAYRHLLFPESLVAWGSVLETWFFEANRLDPLAPLLIAGWLLHRRRRRLRALRHSDARPAVLGVAGAGLAAALLLGWSTHARAPDLAALSLIFAGLALAFAWGGAAASRSAALPLALLLFAVPLPPPLYNALVWKLQLWTTAYVSSLMGALGLEVVSSGDLIVFANYRFEVIESCAGLRVMGLLTLLSFAMADGLRLRRGETLLFVAAAPGIGFLVNGLRALWIALAPTAELSAHHLGQGFLTLAAACLVQYALGRGLRRLRRRGSPTPAGVGTDESRRSSPPRATWATALGLSAGLAVVSLAVPTAGQGAAPTPSLASLLALRIPEWEWAEQPVQLTFLGATRFGQSVRRVYRRREAEETPEIELFAGVGASDGRRGFPFGPKTPLPGPGWVAEWELPGESRIAGAPLRILVVKRGPLRMLVHYYGSGERGLLADSLRSLAGLDAIALAGTARRAVVRLGTPLADAGERERRRAESRLDALLESLREPLSRILLGAGPVFAAAQAVRLEEPGLPATTGEEAPGRSDVVAGRTRSR